MSKLGKNASWVFRFIFSFTSNESLYSAVFIRPWFSLKTSPTVLELKLVKCPANHIDWNLPFFSHPPPFCASFPCWTLESEMQMVCVWRLESQRWVWSQLLRAQSLGVLCSSLQHWCCYFRVVFPLPLKISANTQEKDDHKLNCRASRDIHSIRRLFSFP